MHWAPRPSALFVGEDLGMEHEGDDEGAGGQGGVVLPSRSAAWMGRGYCTVRVTVPVAVVAPEVPVTVMV
jgi:hypothetical protein